MVWLRQFKIMMYLDDSSFLINLYKFGYQQYEHPKQLLSTEEKRKTFHFLNMDILVARTNQRKRLYSSFDLNFTSTVALHFTPHLYFFLTNLPLPSVVIDRTLSKCSLIQGAVHHGRLNHETWYSSKLLMPVGWLWLRKNEGWHDWDSNPRPCDRLRITT